MTNANQPPAQRSPSHRITAFVPSWSESDVDTAGLWAASGAAFLTRRAAGVPAALVHRLDGVLGHLAQYDPELRTMLPAEGLGVISERAAHLQLGAASRRSCGGATQLLRSATDDIAICLARPDDIELIPAWLGCEPSPSAPWPAVIDAVAARDADQLIASGAELGLPVARLGECDRPEAIRAAPLGHAEPRSIVGLNVVNLASLWAGPLCGNLLQRAGARVIKVESRSRPDGARHHHGFFDALHDGQTGISFDFDDAHDIDRLRRLIERADVVIEGSRPRALRQLGISAEQIVPYGPRIWVSITGHGRDPAHEARVGFGDDAAVAGGLVVADSRHALFLADAIADPVTGLLAASGVIDAVERGGRWLLDVALSRAAASMVGPAVDTCEHEFQRHPPKRREVTSRPVPFRDAATEVSAEFDLDQ